MAGLLVFQALCDVGCHLSGFIFQLTAFRYAIVPRVFFSVCSLLLLSPASNVACVCWLVVFRICKIAIELYIGVGHDFVFFARFNLIDTGAARINLFAILIA